MPNAHASRASSSLPSWPPRSSGRRHAPPWTALTLSRASPLLCFLSLSRLSATADAARHHRSHRLPLASPMCPKASPRPPLPPYRAAPRRRPCIDAIFITFVAGHRRSLLPPRSLRCFPEHAEATSVLAVSSCPFSPSPFSLSHAVAITPLLTETRRRPRSSLVMLR